MEFMANLRLSHLIVDNQWLTASTDDEGDKSADEDGNTILYTFVKPNSKQRYHLQCGLFCCVVLQRYM